MFQRYLSFLKKLLFFSPAHDTALIYLSTLVSSGIAFISSLLIARSLGPSGFGIITAYNSIILTLVGLTDFGLGVGLIRFGTPLLKNDSKKAVAFLKFVFFAEVVAGVLVLLIGFAFVDLIHKFVGSAISVEIIKIAIFSAAITSTSAFVTAVLNTYKKFKLNAALTIFSSVLRLVYIGGLVFFFEITVNNVIFGLVGISVLSAVTGFSLIPKDYLQNVSQSEFREAGKAIFKFSGWLTLGFILNSIAGRLDFFYLYKIRGSHEAGVYAAAIQLSLVFTLLIGAISTVMTPYISEKLELQEKIKFLRKAIALSSLGAVAFLLSIFIIPLIINVLFGSRYEGAIFPFQLLIVHFALNVFLIPITLMFIPLGKVYVGTIISALQLGIAFFAYPYLINGFGASGAAGTVLTNTVFATLAYPIALSLLLMRERSKDEKTGIS